MEKEKQDYELKSRADLVDSLMDYVSYEAPATVRSWIKKSMLNMPDTEFKAITGYVDMGDHITIEISDMMFYVHSGDITDPIELIGMYIHILKQFVLIKDKEKYKIDLNMPLNTLPEETRNVIESVFSKKRINYTIIDTSIIPDTSQVLSKAIQSFLNCWWVHSCIAPAGELNKKLD